MLRPVLKFAAVGVIGFAIWQLLWVFLLPLVATVLGFAMFAFKVALIAFLFWLAWRFFQKMTAKEPA